MSGSWTYLAGSACLRELGMEPEVLPVTFPAGLGVEDVDDYAAGMRVTIVARKVRVPQNVPAALPTRPEPRSRRVPRPARGPRKN